MKLSFSGRGIAVLHHYVAKTDIRYYLHGIYVRPLSADEGGGVLAAATNGHVLAMWRDPDGVCERPAILRVSRQLAAACGGSAKSDGMGRRLAIVDNRLTCVAGMEGENEIYVQPNQKPVAPVKIAGAVFAAAAEPWEIGTSGKTQFPDVIPVAAGPAAAEAGPLCAVNTTYLELIGKSLRCIRTRHGLGVRMRQGGLPGAILVTSSEVPELAVIVMPMLDNPYETPPWFRRVVAAHGRRAAVAAAPLPVHEPSDAGHRDDDVTGWALAGGSL